MEEQEQKTSKYNSGIAKIYRMDGLWKNVNSNSVIGNFIKWNEFLDRVWCELSADIMPSDFNDKAEKFKEKDKAISDIGNFDDGLSDGFKSISKELLEKRSKHYKALIDKEMFLRRLENELGKGTAWDEGEDEF
jgi:hypothetical protein